MLPVERQIRILQMLREHRSMSITTLSRALNISENTVRRDLRTLEQKGQVQRVHGGATIVDQVVPDLRYDERGIANLEQKRAIGQRAAELIEDGDTIILDSGTTTYWIGPHLPDHISVTAITNDLKIGVELCNRPNVTAVFLGGLLDYTYSATGSLTERALSELRATKLFLSIQGISLRDGLTDSRMGQAVTKQRMISIARHVILVADSSKVDVVKPYVVGDIDRIHTFITDDGAPRAFLQEVERTGVRVIVADSARVKAASG